MLDIRIAVPEDAAALLAVYAPYVRETAITFEYDVPSISEFQSRIVSTLERYPYFVAEMDGKPVGYAYASAFKQRRAYAWGAEISIYVDRAYHQRHIGSLLLNTLENAMTEQGICTAYACIAAPAEPDPYLTDDSIRFHSSQGYVTDGRFPACGFKFGRWYDMVWMEKKLQTPPVNPQPVLLFSHIRNKI